MIMISRNCLSNASAIIGFGAVVIAVIASITGYATLGHIRFLAGCVFIFGAMYFHVISEKRKKAPEIVVACYFLMGIFFLFSSATLFADEPLVFEVIASIGFICLGLFVWWYIAVYIMDDKPTVIKAVDEEIMSRIDDKDSSD